jgi:methanethiol S-methyltransferase
MLILFPGRVLYVIPFPWIWLFFLAQLLVGIGFLRAFLAAPHRFLIRDQLSGPHGPDRLPLGTKGIYCWIRDPFLLSGLLLIWLTPFMTENLFLVYLITTVFLFLGSLHWESRLVAQFCEAYMANQKKVPRIISHLNKRYAVLIELSINDLQ